MIGLGAANLTAGFLQGFAVSTSGSRTAVAEQSGARSQLAGLVGAGLVVTLLVLFQSLLSDLPQSALAAVVIAAALSLLNVGALRRYASVRRSALLLSLTASVGVILLGVLQGIVLAIVLSVLLFFRRSWWPHGAVVGRVEGMDGWHSVHAFPAAIEVPGVVVYRWEAPLFFANAELFCERVQAAIAAAPGPVSCCVVAAEPVTSVDVTAADAVAELDDTLHAAGIELCFAEMKDPVKDKLKRFGLFSRLGAERFFATIDEAVAAYRSGRADR
jgi:MFS superfamily sulfate permease-like transporter